MICTRRIPNLKEGTHNSNFKLLIVTTFLNFLLKSLLHFRNIFHTLSNYLSNNIISRALPTSPQPFSLSVLLYHHLWLSFVTSSFDRKQNRSFVIFYLPTFLINFLSNLCDPQTWKPKGMFSVWNASVCFSTRALSVNSPLSFFSEKGR